MSGILIIAICAVAAGVYAGSESGAYRLNRLRIRREAETGSRAARMLEGLTRDMERFVCVTLVATNLAYYVATIVCVAELRRFLKTDLTAQLAATFLLAPILLIVSEILPKSIFQARPNRLLRWTAPLLRVSDLLFWPVVKLLRAVITFWQRLLGGRPSRQPVVTSQYLLFYLAEGTQEGVITRQQDLMARSIMEFSTRPLREIMIPLNGVHMIPRDASGDEPRAILANEDHARIPIYDRRRSRVVGILLTLDYLCGGEEGNIEDMMMAPTNLDAETSLNDAFKVLQRAGQTMGIVVDGQGNAVGMVTMGDLLQGIFGSLDRG